ncbi:UNVERIFIED_ORG: hypothetical protein M2435_004626 [Rhizobium sophorae]|uniref:hypothetical protein n=1 Tax=Rhizobium leguminosarum TaxID=384 RepID=UPI0016228AD9|nr:hypothetical protein [Rhizobium leguminosarum]MBB4524630.1 hypothetical protein [Rhizobium leguminosarum]MDH6661705.1 hypothetical protein [Rhizobium sophorae]
MAQVAVAHVAIALFFGIASSPALAKTECIGDGKYRVCTDSYTDAQGNLHIRSYDTEGNSYSVGTETRSFSGGGEEIISRDSDGNSYSVKSWSDSSGAHSEDSEGNSCTITTFGTIIGCGQ